MLVALHDVPDWFVAVLFVCAQPDAAAVCDE